MSGPRPPSILLEMQQLVASSGEWTSAFVRAFPVEAAASASQVRAHVPAWRRVETALDSMTNPTAGSGACIARLRAGMSTAQGRKDCKSALAYLTKLPGRYNWTGETARVVLPRPDGRDGRDCAVLFGDSDLSGLLDEGAWTEWQAWAATFRKKKMPADRVLAAQARTAVKALDAVAVTSELRAVSAGGLAQVMQALRAEVARMQEEFWAEVAAAQAKYSELMDGVEDGAGATLYKTHGAAAFCE